MKYKNQPLPVEIVFHPSWWHKHAGITFDPDFFYDPRRRVADERKMEQVLYDRFGEFGLGLDRDKDLPQIGAVHLAAGYLVSEMLGCEIIYSEDAPPQVVCANKEGFDIDIEGAFNGKPFRRLEKLVSELKAKYGYVCGDINWGGVLNLAIDLKGEAVLMDMVMEPEKVKKYFRDIAEVIERFFFYINEQTGTSSISVNRLVRLLDPASTFLHSECTHTMISDDDYAEFLLPIDVQWSLKYRPYAIHYCGRDPHRHAEKYGRIPHLDFFDLGWGGDVPELRKYLPETFFSLRLNPVDLNSYSHSELETIIEEKVKESGIPALTGICCVNMDSETDDEKVKTIYRTAERIRKEWKQ